MLLKTTKFFNLPVEVSPHKSLNTSKGIIRDRNLKEESDQNILEYLQPQGVTAVKRFKVKKGQVQIPIIGKDDVTSSASIRVTLTGTNQ